MPGIDITVSVTIWMLIQPIKDKERNIGHEKQKATKEETDKLMKFDFIREIQYTDNYPMWHHAKQEDENV